jgi:hypothetical protein
VEVHVDNKFDRAAAGESQSGAEQYELYAGPRRMDLSGDLDAQRATTYRLQRKGDGR